MESLRIIESVLGYSGDFFSALSSAEGGKSSRRQPCCCAIDTVICFYTVACCLEPALRVIWVGRHRCFFSNNLHVVI